MFRSHVRVAVEEVFMCVNKEVWKIIPESLPGVKRNCSKCGVKREFINSGKFRINANGKNIDVWLIYRCEKCGTTWNMAVYERKAADTLDREEYLGFMENDSRLAIWCGRDPALFAKNRAEAVLTDKGYCVETTTIEGKRDNSKPLEVEIEMHFPMKLRLDRLLADQLGVSRSAIKQWCDTGIIFRTDVMPNEGRANKEAGKSRKGLLGETVKNGMKVHIKYISAAK